MDRSRTVKNRKISVLSYRHYDTLRRQRIEFCQCALYISSPATSRNFRISDTTAAITKIGTKGGFIIRDREMTQTNVKYDLTRVANTKYFNSSTDFWQLRKIHKKRKTLIIIHMRRVVKSYFILNIWYFKQKSKRIDNLKTHKFNINVKN